MFRHIIASTLFAALLAGAAAPAMARGGGGGGDFGGGGSFGGDSGGGRSGGFAGDRGGFGYDRPQTAADRNLLDNARRECNGPKYPDGATPRVNYDADTFTCFEPGSTRR